MTPATAQFDTTASQAPRRTWFGQAEDWLDSKGKPAWIALMVVGFVVFWPIGLAVLFYMIWGKQMFRKSCRRSGRYGNPSMHRAGFNAMRSSGNSAFDAYKEETLRRLEEEQDSFQAFLERLRAAKDKAEFDQFMDERASKAASERNAEETATYGAQARPEASN